MSVGATAGSTAATAAVAADEAKKREEEERLTNYTKEDLTEGWEFKIIRNSFGFSKDKLEQLCKEESENGWQLLEKFDETRVRFKRPISARENDRYANIDPYRTTYSQGEAKVVGVIILIIILIVAMVAGIFIYFGLLH